MNFKIDNLRLLPHLLRANELMMGIVALQYMLPWAPELMKWHNGDNVSQQNMV